MVKEVEGTFRLSDGTELYEKVWEADGSPTAHLIFLHGFSDHINAYYDLFPTLANAPYNITVHGIDQRGWGRSCQKSSRGLTGPTDQVIKDVDEYVRHVASQSSTLPVFLMGHSMGGGEALYYMLSRSGASTPQISGLILEAPFIDFYPAAAPSSVVVALGRFASRLRPKMQMKQELDPQVMSRDPAVVKEWVEDELCHDTGTLEGLAGLLSRTGELASLAKGGAVTALQVQRPGKVTVGCPVLWLHGTGDQICNFDSSKALYERVLQEADTGLNDLSSHKWYTDAYHKLHAEPDGVGKQFAKDVSEWVCNVSQHATGKSSSVVESGEDAMKSRL